MSPTGWRRRVLLPVALLGVTGCSFYSQSDGDRLRDEVFALRTQLTQLQSKLKSLDASQKRSGTQLAKVSSDVSELNTAARRNDADIGVQLEVLLGDFARVRGQVEGLVDRMSEVEGAASKAQEELDLRFKAIDEQARLEQDANAKQQAAAKQAIEARKALLDTPKSALNAAEKMIADGQPAAARELVRALEIRKGKSKGWGVYAPKAAFLIGESYFAEEKYQKAANAYNTIRKKYPKSKTWLPGSILKMGICFERLDLPDDAKLFYRTVSKKYPKHPAGREGKRLLTKLGG